MRTYVNDNEIAGLFKRLHNVQVCDGSISANIPFIIMLIID